MEITNFDYDETTDVVCEHCGTRGIHAILYMCCAEAEMTWRRITNGYIPPQPVLIVHPSEPLPDWLSLRSDDD